MPTHTFPALDTNNTFTGQNTFTDLVSLNNSVVFAEEFGTLQLAINALPVGGGIVYLPAATYTVSGGLTISGNNVTLQGASPTGTILQANPGNLTTIDAIEYATQGAAQAVWAGTGVTVNVFNTMVQSKTLNTSNPFPAKGSFAMSLLIDATGNRTVTRTVSLNLSALDRLGLYLGASTTAAASVSFFLGDGTHTALWTVSPATTYNVWNFNSINLGSPTSGTVNLAAVTSMGFSGLVASTLYYVDYIGAWLNANDVSVITVTGTAATITDLSVQQVAIGNSDCITLSSGSNHTINNVATLNGRNGVLNSVPNTRVHYCTFTSSSINGLGSTGNKAKITENYFLGIANSPIVSLGNQAYIAGNDIDSCTNNAITNQGNDCTIIGNTIENCDFYGIYNNGGLSCTIEGNSVQNCNETGIQLQNNCTGTSITGNAIFNIGKNAIDVGGSSFVSITGNSINTTGNSNGYPTTEARGIFINGSRISVTGNQISNVGLNGAGGAEGITLITPSSYCTVTGNEIYNSANASIRSASANNASITGNQIDLNSVANTQGIFLDTTSVNILVSGNTVNNTGAGGAFILDQSTGSVYGVNNFFGTYESLTLPLNRANSNAYSNITSHIVADTATLSGGTVTVTLNAAVGYTGAATYICVATDVTGANPVKVVQNSGTSITFTGTGTDVIQYICIGN